jgi:hypothetical protein
LGIHQDGNDHSYFCSFKVGTSDKEFHLLLDSAASNTWLMSSDCTTNACTLHNTLGSRDSSSLRTATGTFSVRYGTGSVSGGEGIDTVHFGGMSVPLTFGLAQNVSDEFSFFPMDGILGLGRQENIADKTGMIDAPALMDVLMTEKVITNKLYAMDLWRASDGGANTGALHFGKPDTSRYEGDLNYIPAIRNTQGFWEIPVQDASVNGNRAGMPGRTAIIDSGTSYMLMPRDDAVQLHELITGYRTDGSEGFTVPCDSTAKMQFTFGSVTYDIQPADYIGAQLANGACSTNIIGRRTFGERQWLVGDVFLKNVYTVFDFEGQRVGFGVKRAGGGAGAGPSSTGMLSDDVVTDVPITYDIPSSPAPTSTTATSLDASHTSPSEASTSPEDVSLVTTTEGIVITTELTSPATEAAEPSTANTPTPSTSAAQEDTTTPPSPPSDASDTASIPPSPATSSQAAQLTMSTLLTQHFSASGPRPPAVTSPNGATLLPPGASTNASTTAGPGAAASSTAEAENAGVRVLWTSWLALGVWVGIVVLV